MGCNAFVDLDEIRLEDSTPVACDPVAQAGCADRFACVFSFTGVLTPVCSAEIGSQGVGEACDSTDLACAPGLQCVNWPAELGLGRICSTICVMDSNEGCASGETCINHFGDQLETYGFCVASCDPSGADCGADMTCQQDPYFTGNGEPGHVCIAPP